MPNVDFDRLHGEITMRQVLEILAFEPNRCAGERWSDAAPCLGVGRLTGRVSV